MQDVTPMSDLSTPDFIPSSNTNNSSGGSTQNQLETEPPVLQTEPMEYNKVIDLNFESIISKTPFEKSIGVSYGNIPSARPEFEKPEQKQSEITHTEKIVVPDEAGGNSHIENGEPIKKTTREERIQALMKELEPKPTSKSKFFFEKMQTFGDGV